MSYTKITHNQFIGIYENVLSKDTCKNVIELFENDLKNKVGVSEGGKQFNKEKMDRNDFFKLYLSNEFNNKIVETVNQALEKSIILYAEEFWTVKQIKATSLEIKLQKTPPKGGYHLWHCEQQDFTVANRVLVWTVYLNDIPSGEGETEFLWQGLRVQPKAGTVSIFPASFTHTHRGNPVYSCDKYIATGWYTLYE
jgi:hypothetical protein